MKKSKGKRKEFTRKVSLEIGFDVSEILFHPSIYIYGGALRDITCGKPINDLDILCPPSQYKKLYIKMLSYASLPEANKSRLDDGLFNLLELVDNRKLESKDEKYYDLWEYIQTPITLYATYNGNRKKIQIIQTMEHDEYDEKSLIELLIKNVDFTMNGLGLNNEGLFEFIPGATKDIKKNELWIQPNAIMIPKRYKPLIKRIKKFRDRGWKVMNLDDIFTIKMIE